MDWYAAEQDYDDDLIGRTTIPRAIATSAERHANHDAQAYKGGVYDRTLVPAALSAAPADDFTTIDYYELHGIIQTLTGGFRAHGVTPDDRIAIFAQTRMEWAHADLALLAAGAVVTTVYPNSSPRRTQYLLDDAGASGVIVENAELLDRVRAVENELDLDFIVTIDRLPRDHTPPITDLYTLGDIYEAGQETTGAEYEQWLDERDPGDLASIIYTSGTTGDPKGVPLTHANFKANIDQCRRRYGPRPDKTVPTIDETSRAVSFLPLAHSFERLAGHFLMFVSGAMVAYAESPDTLREDFAAIRPTSGTSVPRVYERIYAAIRDDAGQSTIGERVFRWADRVGRAYGQSPNPGILLSAQHRLADILVFSKVRDALGGHIDFLVSGGGSLPEELCALYHGMGLPILEGYGLTETAPVVSGNPAESPQIGTIGVPMVDLETRIDTHAQVEGFDEIDGDIGELLVRGPNVFEGYWHRPEETAAVFDDGWFRTGDIVAKRDDGYLVFLERQKELIVLSTGLNLAPTPIEDALASSSLIEQAIVIGDNRKFTAALIVPNHNAVHSWAARANVPLPDNPTELCQNDRVHARIAAEVETVNATLQDYETIKEFRLIPEEFTEENNLLTPTLKKKRRAILERYDAEVNAIYDEV